MLNTGKLAGKTVFISGASRGIGKSIALKIAKDGANVVIAAKTAQAHPKLPGTIYSSAEEIEKIGGKALPCIVDVRDENQVKRAVEEAVKKFGGIDIVVNNASAISPVGTENLEMKRYDLMHQINIRGTFLVSKYCIPHLKRSKHAHILNISPPLDLSPQWFAPHVAYTISKYGMTMCALGMAEEFKPFNIAVNTLWPKTVIQTAAWDMLAGKDSSKYARTPEIMSDAAYAILTQDPKSGNASGKFHIDEDVLRANGVTEFDHYCVDPAYKDQLIPDSYVGVPPKSSKMASTEQEKEVGQVGGLFKKIEASINEDVVKATDAVFQFVVTGKEEGKWYLDLKSGAGKCGKGEAEKADATLQMDSDNFLKLFTGKTKPATAYMMGKLKIKGNIQKALKLEKLMSSLKSKL